MKKLSIIIFTILTLLTPVFFANAAVVPITINPVNNTTGVSVSLSIKGLSDGTSFGVYVLKKSDNSVSKSLNGTVSNGVASVPAVTGLVPGVTYKILLNNSEGIQLATNEFTTIPVTGKLSFVSATSNSIELKVDLSLVNIPYFVQIYKKGDTTPLDHKDAVANVIFDKLTPNTAYTTSLFVRGNEAKSLFDYPFTTNQLTGATVNTFDLKSTSTSLEFHSLPVGKTFTAFVKADSDNGNTTSFYFSSTLTPTTKIGDIVYAENFNGLTPGSLYIGGIVGDIDVHFKTPLTDGVNYTILEETISTAESLYYNSEEGTAVGQYASGSREILNTELQKTITWHDTIKANSSDNPETIQYDAGILNAKLTDAIDVFKSKIVGGVPNAPKTPSQKPGFWSKGGGIIPECPNGPCGFNELMQLINNVIKFLLFTIATPLAALGIVYAGWLYLSAGGSTENTTKAKKILTNIIIGYVIALAAWLIVNTILKSLGLDSSIDTFLK